MRMRRLSREQVSVNPGQRGQASNTDNKWGESFCLPNCKAATAAPCKPLLQNSLDVRPCPVHASERMHRDKTALELDSHPGFSLNKSKKGSQCLSVFNSLILQKRKQSPRGNKKNISECLYIAYFLPISVLSTSSFHPHKSLRNRYCYYLCFIDEDTEKIESSNWHEMEMK